ncbi:repetitive organellar protein-like isoform X1 [Astyanax mexicanus]|uniref:repetitive organellar protein-like isoform X1 n=1 Tax=Astyanax mexicanus TaxID=7994 RepID=UPI0020CB02D3|nr:repetitive organellar protein-like isoform X1 [Astyanax mexicanus]
MSAVYLLLLLVLGCSLLEGQSVRVNSITLRGSEDRGDRENEIQAAENPTTEATTTTSTQQSCQQDIHSVLREMSAVLAELKVEQRHTTTAVNNLESRLRASESQVEELKKKSEEKLNDLKTSLNHEGIKNQEKLNDLKTSLNNEVEILKKENQEKLNDLKTSLNNEEIKNQEKLNDLKTSLNNEVEILKKENQAQAVNHSTLEVRFETEVDELKTKSDESLKDLKNSLKITENNVEILKKENQERKVVFSASLSGGEAANHGPYSIDVTLVYKHVFINIGNAYNPVTGIFTAPARGVYEFKIYAFGLGGRTVSVSLQKNGHHVTGAHAYQQPNEANSSNGVSLLLEVGDVVCVKVRANDWVYDSWFHHTTFSGQMLFPV